MPQLDAPLHAFQILDHLPQGVFILRREGTAPLGTIVWKTGRAFPNPQSSDLP